MRIATLTTVAAFALAAAACNNNQAANDVSTDVNLAEDAAANDVLGANAMTDNEAAVALPTDASGFATAAAASDLYEIESAKLAASKAASADIKSFAQHVRTDHEKSSAELKSMAASANVTVTPALDAEKQRMLDQLKAANGAEFDRLFLDQQKTAHQKALSLHQGYASGGDNAALKGFASKTAGVVKGHLDHANSIKL
jgi:putative membrane protein